MTKKKIFAILFMILAICSTLYAQNNKNNSFSITANIKGLKNSKIILYLSGDVIDSTFSKKGVFNFKGLIETPSIYNIKLSKKKNIVLFLDNSNISIIGDINSIKDIKITNSRSNDEYQTLKPLLDKYYDAQWEAYGETPAYFKRSKEEKIKNSIIYDSIGKIVRKATYAFMLNNKKSKVTPYLASTFFNSNFVVLDSIYKDFDFSATKNKYELLIKKQIDKMAPLQLGKQAPEIIQTDTSGANFSVASLKGKYVLIDFWASWCGPCRGETPNLVKAYETYKNKGFEIVSISLDDKRDKWIKAIIVDKMSWIQLSDLNGWDNKVAEIYDIHEVPSTFLLDKNGKILAKGLRGEALQKKLAELIP